MMRVFISEMKTTYLVLLANGWRQISKISEPIQSFYIGYRMLDDRRGLVDNITF
jgi:hypothetical protein